MKTNKQHILEMAEPAKEYDSSLNDFVDRVRSAFSKQFPTPSYSYDTPGGGYCWATDIFQDHVIAREGDKYYNVAMTVTEDKITFAAKEDWTEVYLRYVAEMLGRERRQDVILTYEVKGAFPKVPFASGVDVPGLTEGDDSPVFVTLPIGKAGVTSGNNRHYDESFLTELEKQVLSKKPVGLFGHLSAEARATQFPAEAVHWVGAVRVGELLWGKGYVPPGEARLRLQRYKSTGKTIATSIDAWIEGAWDETLNAYRMKADTLELNQIDIAPADRAGVRDLAAVPHLTSEMAGYGTPSTRKDRDMEIQELTAADASKLPQAVREAVVADSAAVKTLASITGALGLAEGVDPVAAVQEMAQAAKAQKAAAVKARITELAGDKEKGIKVDAVRSLVVELVTARNPQTTEEAEAAYKAVCEMQSVKDALASAVVGTMGPRQGVPVGSQNGSGKYFVIPKEQVAA